MTNVYPTDEKVNFPPSYEQATHYPSTQPIPSAYPMQPAPPTIYPPQSVGMYAPQTMPIGGYPPGMVPPPIGTHMMITTRSLIYGDLPIQCLCPHCHMSIVTRVEMQNGLVTWLACAGILLLGGWLGCCLIPFCVDGLKDVEHYCPNCAVLLGTRRRM